MELIVTHNNCDFDGLASVWALLSIHPFAKVYLPSAAPNVKKYISLYLDKDRLISGIEITYLLPSKKYDPDT